MTFHSSVLYANEPGATFDMNYYIQTHMPLVDKHWGPLGLKKWEVVDLVDSPDGSKPFIVAALLTWTSEEDAKKAFTSLSAQEVFGDIPKYTTLKAQLFMGKVIASS